MKFKVHWSRPHVSKQGGGVYQFIYRCMDVIRDVTGLQTEIRPGQYCVGTKYRHSSDAF